MPRSAPSARPSSPVAAPTPRAGPPAWVDLIGALVAALPGAWLWAADRAADPTLLPAGAPWWARPRDFLLEGPDAGAWASAATAVATGRAEDLDAHRLPILPHLTAAGMRIHPDPALAGHLVNHLLFLALGPVVYLLGRAWMGRGYALGAAVAAVIYAPAVVAADRYGVDPLVALALPLGLLAAEGAARRWALAGPLGVVVGLAASSHLTTVGLPIAALLLTFLRGTPGWRRWLGALGLVGGMLVGGGLAFSHYPVLPWGLLTGSLAEGVAKAAPTADSTGLSASMERALATVREGGPAALERAVAFLAATARPTWLPWAAALWLPWLGVLGFGLHPRPEGGITRAAWAERLLSVVRGLGAGLPLAAALVPILAFAAADSPRRYTDNFYPLAALVMFRGLAVPLTLLERALASRVSAWRVGALGFLVGPLAAGSLWNPDRALTPLRMPPGREEVADRALGALLRDHFPPGGGAACMRREAIAYAGRAYCPFTPGFDYRNEPEPFRAHLAAECRGEGPIPYVIVSGVDDGSTTARHAMDAWVEAHEPLVDTLRTDAYEARLYAVARSSGAP